MNVKKSAHDYWFKSSTHYENVWLRITGRNEQALIADLAPLSYGKNEKNIFPSLKLVFPGRRLQVSP
jgi:hypothetical protein